MAPSSRISLTAVAAALLLSGTATAAEGIPQARAVELRREAAAHAYLGASLVLKCLSDARRDQKSDLDPAKGELIRSKQTYEVLVKSDRAEAPIPEVKDKDWSERLNKIFVELEMSGIKVERTEAGIALANIEAINRIGRQISDWKDCGTVIKRPSALLALLENKITLERTTQLAEGAWGGPY